MSTGRAYDARRPLTADEKQIASTMIDGVRITSQAEAEKLYMQKRDLMDRMKAAGVIQNG